MNFKEFHGYKVYDNGVVIGKRGEPLLYSLTRGYRYVCLCIDGKEYRKSVHTLMGKLFLPNFKGLPTINHKDQKKKNNSLYNLEWASYRDQVIKRNMLSNNKSGHVGVLFVKTRNTWRATIFTGVGNKMTKTFYTKEEAIKQRKEWELEYYQK